MKHPKRVLSLLLALALGLALCVPAFAVEPADPNAPIITKQPKGLFILAVGQELKLEIKAQLPEGSEGTLSIAWYDYDWQPGDETPPIATGEIMSITITEDMLSIADGMPFWFAQFCAVATHTYVDADETEQILSIKSDLADGVLINKIIPGATFMFREFYQICGGGFLGVVINILFSPIFVPLSLLFTVGNIIFRCYAWFFSLFPDF